VLLALLAPTEQWARQLAHEVARTTTAVCAAAAMALLTAAEQRSGELAHKITWAAAAAAVAAVLLVTAHEGIHGEALRVPLAHASAEARMLRTPRPPARSVDSPWPGTPLVPSSGALYGFVVCAGVLWLEPAPMGASLVGRSHCDTPVLIWT
jgi:hypothetical protein